MAINLLNTLKTAGAIAPPAIIIALVGFVGKGVVDNDRRNTDEHIEIRREMVAGDARVTGKVDLVKDIVSDIRIEQRVMLETLKRIEAK